MLRKIRLLLAVVMFVGINLLFLDVTGLMHSWFGWMAKIQLLPALLTGGVVGCAWVVMVIILTLLMGRIYCSVVCPLGIFQDLIAKMGRIGRKTPYSYSKEKTLLRVVSLIAFVVVSLTGMMSIAGLVAPYSAYGRMAGALLQPLYVALNNLLAGIAEHYDSYAFYSVETMGKGLSVMIVALVTFAVVGVLALRNGRTWCNTICPVGTLLGFVSRFSRLKIVIDENACRNCGKCARNCKAACIDAKHHKVDYSRCVVCGNCLENCEFDAITYGHKPTIEKEIATVKAAEEKKAADGGRRSFLLGMAMATTATALAQEKKKVDGGLAVIEDKQRPERKTRIVPPGAGSIEHLSKTCTACQLCISACPNNVLVPSTDLQHFMQPQMTYENGYCRPECHKCSDVCPTGAIVNIGLETKVSTQVGHAVVVRKNCVPITDGVSCGNCERHCPTGAIQMVPSNPDDEGSVKVPVVDETRCIGCGACENLCPARPFSAIYVEGHEVQKEV